MFVSIRGIIKTVIILQIKDINLNYIDYGNKDKPTILYLHGWGQNIEMMKMLGDRFEKTNRIIIVDLPGFGQSEEPKLAWQVKDYVECIKELVDKLKIKKPTIVGHSFGGKIGLLYASKYEVNKLICLASPFCKEIQKATFKIKLLKTAKKIPLLNKLESYAKKHIGSTDYRNASEVMRQILVNTVNDDISEEVVKIKAPTILIWGTQDKEVNITRAYELEKKIKDCGLIVYEGCTHYAYLERLEQTISILKNFIGG